MHAYQADNLKALDAAELEGRREKGWDTAALLSSLCDGHPCRGTFMRSIVSDDRTAFFFDDEYMRAAAKANKTEARLLPGILSHPTS